MPMSEPSTSRMAAFGLGSGAIALFNTLRQLFFAMYVVDVVRVDARLVSLVAVFGLATDLVVVPAIGALADRLRTRFGRRRLMVLAGAIPAGLGFVLLWTAPPWPTATARVVHVVLAYLLAHALQSAVAVPYLAAIPPMVRDYDRRTVLTAMRMGFSLVASLAVAVGAPIAFDAAQQVMSRASSHALVGGVAGALAAGAWLAAGWSIAEVETAPDPRPAFAAMLGTARNPAFRATAVVYLFTWAAFELVALVMPFFLTYCVADGDLAATLPVLGVRVALPSVVLGTLLVSAVPAIPVLTWLAARCDKRIAFVVGVAFWAIAEVGLVALPTGHVGAVVALAAVAGIGVATAHVLPDAMIPDAIDAGEAQTGARSEGAYVAVQDLLRKLAAGIALFVGLQTLGWAGYVAPPAGVDRFVQSASATHAIAALTGPVGLVMLAIAAVAAFRSPLTRARAP